MMKTSPFQALASMLSRQLESNLPGQVGIRRRLFTEHQACINIFLWARYPPWGSNPRRQC